MFPTSYPSLIHPVPIILYIVFLPFSQSYEMIEPGIARSNISPCSIILNSVHLISIILFLLLFWSCIRSPEFCSHVLLIFSFRWWRVENLRCLRLSPIRSDYGSRSGISLYLRRVFYTISSFLRQIMRWLEAMLNNQVWRKTLAGNWTLALNSNFPIFILSVCFLNYEFC